MIVSIRQYSKLHLVFDAVRQLLDPRNLVQLHSRERVVAGSAHFRIQLPGQLHKLFRIGNHFPLSRLVELAQEDAPVLLIQTSRMVKVRRQAALFPILASDHSGSSHQAEGDKKNSQHQRNSADASNDPTTAPFLRRLKAHFSAPFNSYGPNFSRGIEAYAQFAPPGFETPSFVPEGLRIFSLLPPDAWQPFHVRA
jgi:hypothetical protein